MTAPHQPPPLDLDEATVVVGDDRLDYLRIDIDLEAEGLNGCWRERLMPWVEELRAQRATVAALRAERDAAREVLAPLLDRPGYICRFCGVEGWSPNDAHHKPDCPVLRRDALLGRAQEDTP